MNSPTTSTIEPPKKRLVCVVTGATAGGGQVHFETENEAEALHEFLKCWFYHSCREVKIKKEWRDV